MSTNQGVPSNMRRGALRAAAVGIAAAALAGFGAAPVALAQGLPMPKSPVTINVVDVAGNLFATGPGGVWIISPQGKALGRIRLPIYAMNNAFGNDGKTLYMTAWTNIYRIRIKTGGRLP